MDEQTIQQDELPLWAHQVRGIDGGVAAEEEGCRGVCITSPTGGGKSRVAVELARRGAEAGMPVVIYTNRKVLTRQAAKVLTKHGVEHGVLADGYDADLSKLVQIASIQTIKSRWERWGLPQARWVLVDEAHNHAFDDVIEKHIEDGAAVFMLTATPVGMHKQCARLVVAGTNSELRKCGALVPCMVYAPTEPDMRGVKMNAVGEYVHKGMAKRVMQCTVFADVFDHWQRLNPQAKPTLLFAPGVPESRWFVEEFKKRGVEAAHIDGETPDKERDRLLALSEAGKLPVISSFGVMREGLDAPWITHGILLQVCGGLSTYLQIVGRLLRAAPGKDQAVLLDFSGCWHRHGSPNADREWKLGDTDKSLAKARKKAIQEGRIQEPVCCPKCHGVRAGGAKCPHCGYEHVRSVRMVRMLDGKLERMVGNVIKKKPQQTPDQKTWVSCLYRSGRSNRTIGQARGLFYRLTGRALPADCKPQPAPDSVEWNMKLSQVAGYQRFAAKRGVAK